MSTALVLVSLYCQKKRNFVPRGVNRVKLDGWVGGGGAVTAEGYWLSPVRRQVTVD